MVKIKIHGVDMQELNSLYKNFFNNGILFEMDDLNIIHSALQVAFRESKITGNVYQYNALLNMIDTYFDKLDQGYKNKTQ